MTTKVVPVWSETTPTESGWYWIKYKNKRKTYTVCPCQVDVLGTETLVRTARNDIFIEGPDHGGPGMKYNGQVDKSVRFGPKIQEPTEN